jgi:hypothetical protein
MLKIPHIASQDVVVNIPTLREADNGPQRPLGKINVQKNPLHHVGPVSFRHGAVC